MKINIDKYKESENLKKQIEEHLKKAMSYNIGEVQSNLPNIIDSVSSSRKRMETRREAFEEAERLNKEISEKLNSQANHIDSTISKVGGTADAAVSLNLKSASDVTEMKSKASKGDSKVSVQDAQDINNMNETKATQGTEKINLAYVDSITDSLNGIKDYIANVQNVGGLNITSEIDYANIANNLMEKYNVKNISEVNKLVFLMSNIPEMNVYISVAEKIVEISKDMPVEFKNTFGMDLYYKNEAGEQITNVNALAADLFANVNQDSVFTKDKIGRLSVNSDAVSVDSQMNMILNEAYKNKDVNFFQQLLEMIINMLRGLK